jgi:hypothetical protein
MPRRKQTGHYGILALRAFLYSWLPHIPHYPLPINHSDSFFPPIPNPLLTFLKKLDLCALFKGQYLAMKNHDFLSIYVS